MQVTRNDQVDLESYQLKDVADIWYTQEFMNLRQGNMIVQEYGLKCIQLSRYAPHMVADSTT